MSLWWLQQGWTDALCARCGRNIWRSGGDPDWGLCYDCFSGNLEQREPHSTETDNEDEAGYSTLETIALIVFILILVVGALGLLIGVECAVDWLMTFEVPR